VSHINNCLKCVAFSPNTGKEGFLPSIPKGSKPFELIHIDHYGPVHSGRSKKHIFVVVDGFTKITNTREVIIALKDYIRAYSKPKCIISDRGSCFTSKEFDDFMLEFDIKHMKIATGSPQANGQVERINRSLGPMIAKLVEPEKGIYGDSVIDKLEHVPNNTRHRSIKQSSSKMLFCLEQKGKVVDELKEKLEELDNAPQERDLENVRIKAEKCQEKAQAYIKLQYDKKARRPSQYKQGRTL